MTLECPRQDNGELLTLDLAIARYKQGRCPCCGKGRGDHRGLEYRPRPNDLFCHTCKSAGRLSWILLICGVNSQIRWTLCQILAHVRLLTFFRNAKRREPRQKPEGSGKGSSASFGGGDHCCYILSRASGRRTASQICLSTNSTDFLFQPSISSASALAMSTR